MEETLDCFTSQLQPAGSNLQAAAHFCAEHLLKGWVTRARGASDFQLRCGVRIIRGGWTRMEKESLRRATKLAVWKGCAAGIYRIEFSR